MRLHQNNLGPENIWKLSIQLCLGIEFCHAHSVLHRDLKPQNLLIDHRQKELTLKLADFGLARQFDNPARRYTPEVVTVWYRAPELLLSSGFYGALLDMWGVGCIIAEMAVGRPLFDGDSEIGTILRIFKTLGTPSEVRWPDVKHLPYFENKKYPMWPENHWAKDHACVLQQLAFGGVDLVASCLVYDPKRRLPAKRAVKHQYFQIECVSQRSHHRKTRRKLQLPCAQINAHPRRLLYRARSEEQLTQTWARKMRLVKLRSQRQRLLQARISSQRHRKRQSRSRSRTRCM